jgi:Putative transposase
LTPTAFFFGSVEFPKAVVSPPPGAGPAAALANSRQFTQLIPRLHRHDWVVYAKPAFGGPLRGLRSLGRYTHGEAISNHRWLTFEQEHVTSAGRITPAAASKVK